MSKKNKLKQKLNVCLKRLIKLIYSKIIIMMNQVIIDDVKNHFGTNINIENLLKRIKALHLLIFLY